MILSLILLLLHTPEPAEIQLFNRINQYRVSHGKTALKYCDSLSYVAETHSIDLFFHFDIKDPCSLHTWSYSTRWTGGCIPEGKNNKWGIMYNKPKELLGMDVYAYEIAAMNWDKKLQMTPDELLDLWINSKPHKNVILENGWPKPFKRMGVSIYKGVSTVWFSE